VTSKADVFADQVDAAWLEFRQEIDRLAPEAFDAPTPAGWTVKEMLAHVAFWSETVEPVVVGMLREEPISEADWYGGDDLAVMGPWPPAYVHNAREAEWGRSRSVKEVLARLDAAHRQAVKIAASLNDREMADDRFTGKVRAATIDHYTEHLAELRKARGSAPGSDLRGS
jgi:hypothetical protein